MGDFQAASCKIAGPFKVEAVTKAAKKLRSSMDHPAQVALVFVSANYAQHLSEFCEILRVDGHIVDVIGCTASGWIEGASEFEGGSGCSILALHCDVGDPVALVGDSPKLPASLNSDPPPNAVVILANPFVFDIDDWLKDWNKRYPGLPIMGGLASGGGEDDMCVFHNGKIVDAVVLPVIGQTTLIPVLSQGCRPIGEPFTVTRAEHNVLYALGNQSAYNALESAFQTLTEDQKSHARGNLFAGLVGNEYVEDFQSGDFLIKNIIGADPGSGAVVIGGIPRVGQTLQYQLRDRSIAIEDLDRAYDAAPAFNKRAFASLLFSCLGRGKQFFGDSGKDAARLADAVGGKPSAGFFCNGEIAPVRGLNALHGNTAAAAIWVKKIP